MKKSTVLDVFQSLSENNCGLILKDDTFIESSLMEYNEFDALKTQQEGKPFYVPEQETF